MAKRCISLFLVSFFFFFASCLGVSEWANQKQGNTWCVAIVSAPPDKLQGFIDSTCSQLDCSPIRPGGACFEPNTLRNHASYALDLFYKAKGICNSEIGTPAVSDPSFGNCHYP
ncbi:PREDICTED: major pollen allergen Ole e 10-like [Nicotiana attenuata]|uniref:Glucan endo-1,3-beta-d-glucosidase n=1 Tax=Nicotiana attenuata TaxID=49451 RepID=A0A314LAZ2_NICAT|nr:PREDICTED: major pollen allergen Ole e 10-like [Nicotiana attenuata]OIT38239.1 glucan endo-1,3-beta-d-glucosidase [Nicotiana attenuata]